LVAGEFGTIFPPFQGKDIPCYRREKSSDGTQKDGKHNGTLQRCIALPLGEHIKYGAQYKEADREMYQKWMQMPDESDHVSLFRNAILKLQNNSTRQA
jgi:hypothetical protein